MIKEELEAALEVVKRTPADECLDRLVYERIVVGAHPAMACSYMIQKHHLSISPPESRVHRYGGPNAGWGQSGVWTCTSWKLRDKDGERGVAHGDTAEEALLRFLLIMYIRGAVL